VTAKALAPGTLSAGGPPDTIVRLGTAREQADGRWQRAAEILMQCDPDPNDEGCAVGGVPTAATPLPIVTVRGPSGALLSFALSEVMPASAPLLVGARIRVTAAPEVLTLVRAGDRDDCLDDRAATVVAIGPHPAGATQFDVTLRLGVDPSAEGSRYRGRPIKAGAPFTLTTERYLVGGTVLSVGTREGEPK
jgi:hypothetical protein